MKRQPLLEHARLEGEVVVLRPLRREDAEPCFPMLHGQRPILDWLVWQGPEDLEQLGDAYSRWVLSSDAGDDYRFALEERASGSVCGTIALRFVDHPFVGDVGYWIGESFWGRGLASEANFLVAHLAFRQLQATVLMAEVFTGNDASCRVLEKIGYRRERSVRTRPLTDTPLRADREEWLYTLKRSEFDRLHGGRAPRGEQVRVAP